MNANARPRRTRHAFLAVLELLTLALLVAGLSWTLLRTMADANVRANECLHVQQLASRQAPVPVPSGL
jgi:hypothetical protein